ncbi:MAG TPA: hypothetical protein VK060_09630 [Ruania sp.]|nr:hypothetical protein [Ruania sp.]
MYLFLGPRQEVLYVGTATNLRRRVRSYFTAAEKRRRIGEMVDLATAVRPIPCATPLEAAVRELRAIAEHDPRYNRRSRAPQRRPWVRLTAEAYPRLSVARNAPPLDGGACLGPFPSRAAASLAVEAIVAATGLRTCTAPLPRVPAAGANACILLELGRCAAPCVHTGTDYATRVTGAQRVLGGDAGAVVDALRGILARLTAQERFEEAAVRRDQLLAYLRTAARAERLGPLRRARQILAARRREGGGWEILLLRYGRFAGTVLTPPGRSPMPAVAALSATGEQVVDTTTVAGPASDEETALLADWLERPGTRLIECDLDAADGPGWSVPVHGAQHHLEQLAA